MRVLVATSNRGKLRDFAGAAQAYGIAIEALAGFAGLPEAVEDGTSFEENARKKSEHYSRFAPGELVLADDSGLCVEALGEAPGVHSARYALLDSANRGSANMDSASVDSASVHSANMDSANNARLLAELSSVDDAARRASFVCVLSAARDGCEVAHFRGEVAGRILRQARGNAGFGYDPLFYLPEVGKSFAELAAGEKAGFSHRGAALRKFLAWARPLGS